MLPDKGAGPATSRLGALLKGPQGPRKPRPAKIPFPSPQHTVHDFELFNGLLGEDCADIASRMRRVDFAPREIIAREGTPGESMFFITEGRVEVWRKDPQSGIDFPVG